MGRLYGDLAQARRSTSIATARFLNLILVPASWSVIGGSITATQGIDDPFGGTGAVRLTASPPLASMSPIQIDRPVTPVAGDKFIFGGWFRVAGGMHNLGNFFLRLSLNGSLFPVPIPFTAVEADFDGNGEWQFYTGSMTVAAGLGGQSSPYSIRYGIGPANAGSIDCYGLFFHSIPASLGLADNEVSEYLACTKAQAQYLQPGMAGTVEGNIFIAHGGLGIDSTIARAVGGASGQLTLGSVLKYEPRYAAD